MPVLERKKMSTELSLKGKQTRAGYPGVLRVAAVRRATAMDSYLHSAEAEILRKPLFAFKKRIPPTVAVAPKKSFRITKILKNRLSGEIAYLREHKKALMKVGFTLCASGGLAAGCVLGIFALHFFETQKSVAFARLDMPPSISAPQITGATQQVKTAPVQQVSTTDMECLPRDKALCRAAIVASQYALSPLPQHHTHHPRAGFYTVSDKVANKD